MFGNLHLSTAKNIYIQLFKLLCSNTEDLKKGMHALREEHKQLYGRSKTEEEIYSLLVNKIITVASCCTGAVGGVTALPGAIPGYGLLLAMGGAELDNQQCKELHHRMITAIAVVYGYDVPVENSEKLNAYMESLQRLCNSVTVGGTQVGTRLFIGVAEQVLKGTRLQTVQNVFGKLNIPFTRSGFVKKIPLGVGALVGFSCNMASTRHLGLKAEKFFCTLFQHGIVINA